MVVCGRNEVGTDQLIRTYPADRESDGKGPERPGASRVPQRIDGRPCRPGPRSFRRLVHQTGDCAIGLDTEPPDAALESCLSAPERSRSPPPDCSTGGPLPRIGGTPTAFGGSTPSVRLDPDVLFVDDGDILTSAGVAAGIDLCLHIVRLDHGPEVVNRAARRCVVIASSCVPLEPDRELPLTLADLAGEARVSVRTLTRRWRAETGLSPLRWLLTQRVQLARDLLESTDLSVEQVARRSGLGSAASLRAHLRAAVGQSPTGYRGAFRAVPSI
jgi:AraC-like DNA-binding protein